MEENEESNIEVLTFENILVLKRTIDEQHEAIGKLKEELMYMHEENEEIRNTLEAAEVKCEETIIENELELLSELEEKDSEIRNWDASTTGLQNIINNKRTAISNNILLCASLLLEMTPPSLVYNNVKEFFSEGDIDTAKNVLFDVCGDPDTAIGNKELRKGGRKESKKEKDLKEQFVTLYNNI